MTEMNGKEPDIQMPVPSVSLWEFAAHDSCLPSHFGHAFFQKLGFMDLHPTNVPKFLAIGSHGIFKWECWGTMRWSGVLHPQKGYTWWGAGADQLLSRLAQVPMDCHRAVNMWDSCCNFTVTRSIWPWHEQDSCGPAGWVSQQQQLVELPFQELVHFDTSQNSSHFHNIKNKAKNYAIETFKAQRSS